jgi:hypothetical protein
LNYLLKRNHDVVDFLVESNVIYTWYTNDRLLNPCHGNKRRVSGIKGGHALCKALESTSCRPDFKRGQGSQSFPPFGDVATDFDLLMRSLAEHDVYKSKDASLPRAMAL